MCRFMVIYLVKLTFNLGISNVSIYIYQFSIEQKFIFNCQ